MTKDEFMSLPPTIALGLIYDVSAAVQKAVTGTEKPRSPLPPKYDRKVYRKGGYHWASEMSLESLTYWLGKKKEGAASGSDWAQKDAKEAEQLQRWVDYRTWYPNNVWNGIRGDDEVRARAPSKSPQLHSNDASPAVEAAKARVREVFKPGDAYDGPRYNGAEDDGFDPNDRDRF